jgi:uncharacterized damage-inducible protein DinB
MTTEAQYLAAWSAAVRESTLKRLRRVPEGHENWRLSPQAMSFADLAQHVIDSDAWLFRKLADRSLEPMVGHAGISHITARSQYLDLLTCLHILGADRERLISGFTADQLAETVFDRRFGGEVTVWWVLVRGNLDHEVHHRGQISVYLRAAGIPPL